MEKIICETKEAAIKEICLGGRIIDGSLGFGYGREGEVVCTYLMIEMAHPLLIRQAYRNESQAFEILDSYFNEMAQKADRDCITWRFGPTYLRKEA